MKDETYTRRERSIMLQRMKKRLVLVVVIAALGGMMAVLIHHPVKAALPLQNTIEKTKKITIVKKGYLKVTSDREINHMLYVGQMNGEADVQSAYGTEVYFAVTPGVYYVKSFATKDFSVRYKKIKAGKLYLRNTTRKLASPLAKGRTEVALSYASEKPFKRYRYYKITPDKNERIRFLGGMLYDSEGKMIPSLTFNIYPNADAKQSSSSSKKLELPEDVMPGAYLYGQSVTMEKLQVGKSYYLKVDMKSGYCTVSGQGKNKKRQNSAIKVTWNYDVP